MELIQFRKLRMSTKEMESDSWLYEIKPKNSIFALNLKEVWQYRDLLVIFVQRDITTVYKQTILGPLWFFIQPLFTTITFTLIFNNLAGIQTGVIPAFLFNMSGIVVWNYFTSCLNATSDTFKSNAAIFGKVYFPRLIVPISIVISNLLKFVIQLLIFVTFYVYYYYKGAELSFNFLTPFFPILILLMGVLGLGLGMLISSVVTKYRDFSQLLGFGVQLLMYVSAVMYPMALIQEKIPEYAGWIKYNPLAYFIETARYMMLNVGEVSAFGLLYSVLFVVVIFFLGLIMFNKTEKSFIDTV